MEDLKKYQCPSCGGPLQFDANTQKIVCEFCGSSYEEDYFNKEQETNTSDGIKKTKIDWLKEGFIKEKPLIENQVGYDCTSCGAEIISDGNTAATECMYCGNPVVLNENVTGMVEPDMIIPFKIDKANAERALSDFYKGKHLLPNTFKDQNRIKKIVGMYVPFWLFSGIGEGGLSLDGTKVTSIRSGNYNVTTTRFYKINREGSLPFKKIPVDASKKMLDNYMDGIEPYKYEDLVDFNSAYMAGYFADKFDVNIDECAKRSQVRILNTTKDVLKNTATGYTTLTEMVNTIKANHTDARYVLLPVWILNTKYNGKMYHFAINGQTGKVAGDLPIDKRKQLFYGLGIFAITYIIVAMFVYMIYL